MRTLGLKRGSAAVVASAAACCAATLLAVRNHPPALAALWSATILASFVGWGSLANLWLAPQRWMDTGLRAGWGMAFFIVVGGFLCGTHLAVRPVIAAHVGLGVVALLWIAVLRLPDSFSATRLRRRAWVALDRSGVILLVLVVYAMAVFTLVAYLGNHRFQPSDDAPFYFTLPESLVQTGSMFEPYAARRATSFGGHVYLHAAFISIGSIYYLHVVDAGISLVVVAALIVGHVGRSGLKPWHGVPLGLAMLVLFSLRDVRVNTASLMSGCACVVTLYRTVRVPFGRTPDRPLWPVEGRRIIALAGIVVAGIVVRTSNTAAMLPFVGLVLASDFFRGAPWPWTRESLRSVAVGAGLFFAAFVVFLAPWSILMEVSSGTFFFPLGHHNVTPGWTFLTHPASLATEFVMHLFHGRPVGLFIPFAIAGLVPLAGRARNDVVALTVGATIGLVAQTWQSAAFGAGNTARYYFSYVAATAIVIAISAEAAGARTALIAVAVAVHLVIARDDVRDALNDMIKNANNWLAENPRDHEAFDAIEGNYRDIQSHIPAGATVVTAVYEPFWFDFTRNHIMVLDFLGGMGPKPGWPFKQGPEALGRYLVANGVQYLVWVDFNVPHEFYNKAHWTTHLTKTGEYLQGEAVIQLDAEDSIEKLTAARHVVYRGHSMTVVDLTHPPDAAPSAPSP